MATKKKVDYYKQLEKLNDCVISEIEKQLKRIGRKFTSEDEGEIEFFGYEACVEKGIFSIDKNGEVKFENGCVDHIGRCIRYEESISLSDAISILDDLREIKAKKK
jgi:hypothetical protein